MDETNGGGNLLIGARFCADLGLGPRRPFGHRISAFGLELDFAEHAEEASGLLPSEANSGTHSPWPAAPCRRSKRSYLSSSIMAGESFALPNLVAICSRERNNVNRNFSKSEESYSHLIAGQKLRFE